MKSVLLPATVTALVAGAAFSQDGETPAPTKTQSTVHPVVTALAKGASEPLHMTGKVSVSKPETEHGMDFQIFGPGGEMDGALGGGYEGEVEVARTAEGELIVVSKKTAPGFVLYDDGSTRLVEVLEGDKKIRLGTLETEMFKLLDLPSLMAKSRKAIRRAKAGDALKSEVPGEFRLDLPKSLLSPKPMNGDVFFMPATKILGIEAAFALDPEGGDLRSMSFSVLRNDPFSMMMAPVEIVEGELVRDEAADDDVVDVVILDDDGNELEEVPQGVAVELAFQQADESEEGATTLYEFEVLPEGPYSRRLQRALDRMRENVEEIDRQD